MRPRRGEMAVAGESIIVRIVKSGQTLMKVARWVLVLSVVGLSVVQLRFIRVLCLHEGGVWRDFAQLWLFGRAGHDGLDPYQPLEAPKAPLLPRFRYYLLSPSNPLSSARDTVGVAVGEPALPMGTGDLACLGNALFGGDLDAHLCMAWNQANSYSDCISQPRQSGMEPSGVRTCAGTNGTHPVGDRACGYSRAPKRATDLWRRIFRFGSLSQANGVAPSSLLGREKAVEPCLNCMYDSACPESPCRGYTRFCASAGLL